MALTAVALAITDNLPKVAASFAITTADTGGFAFTKTDMPATWVTVTGDADWYFHQADSTATSAMQKVPAGQNWPFRVGKTLNLYCKTASGTTNLIATEIHHGD